MEICELTKDLDTDISDLKSKLQRLKEERMQIFKDNTLCEKRTKFAEEGFQASERLRFANRNEYIRKCEMLGWLWEGRDYMLLYGANICFHREIWSTRFYPRVCKAATDGRAINAKHMTKEEIRLARTYADEVIKKWVAFWKCELSPIEEDEFINKRKGRKSSQKIQGI
jgi:hypothetical protein